MSKMTQGEIVARFAECEDRQSLRATMTELLNDDDVLTEARERRKMFNRAKNEREREIVTAELAPFEDEAKRWEHGQKVYFAKRCHRDFFDFNFKLQRGCRIEEGDWCYVWQYQPKKKYAWLCQPGKPLKRANVIADTFSCRDMKEYGISRTEPALRK